MLQGLQSWAHCSSVMSNNWFYNILLFTTTLYRNKDIIALVSKPILLYLFHNLNLKRLKYHVKVHLINLSRRIRIIEQYI